MRESHDLKFWYRVFRWKTRHNFKHFRRHPPVIGFVIIFAAALFTSWLEHTRFLQALKLANFDAFVVSQDPVESRDVVLVDIDEADYRDRNTFEGRSPLKQDQVMALLGLIARAGPKVIVVDLDTSNWTQGAMPPDLLSKVIWARSILRNPSEPEQLSKAMGKSDAEMVDGKLCWGVPEVLETGGVVRSYQPYIHYGRGQVPSLAWAAAHAYRPPEDLPPGKESAAPNCKELSLLVEPAVDEAHLKTGDVRFSRYTSAQLREFSGFPFQGKVVLLGGTFSEARDSYNTPVGVRPGMEILATAIHSELHHPMPLDPSGWLFFTVDVMFGVILLVTGRILPKVLGLPVVVAGVPAGAVAGSFIAFQSVSYFFSFMPVLVGVFLHRIFDEWWEGLEMRRKNTQLQKDVAKRNRKIMRQQWQLATPEDLRRTLSEKDSVDLTVRVTWGRM